jgi:exopolysaccharide biosynthesis operon protein EpsL
MKAVTIHPVPARAVYGLSAHIGVLALAGLGCANVAHADDLLTLKLATSLVHDSNLFRLPAGNVSALIGRPDAREQTLIIKAEAALRFSHSLQALDIDLQQVSTRHNNFAYLDNTAYSYWATWRWSYSPRVHGTLSSSRQESTDAFTGEQNFTALNQQTISTNQLSATYEIDGNWRVLGGASRVSERSLQQQVGQSDYTSNQAQLGLGYAFASGSSASYLVRQVNGNYQNKVLPSAELIDDRFKQQDHELRVSWSIDGKTSAQLMAMYVQRRHPHYPQRDYQGVNGAVDINLQLSGKTALTLGLARELSSYQTANANFSQVDRLVLGSVWSLTPKMQARARYELGRRKYKGTPVDATVAPNARHDTTHDAQLSLEWQPYKFVVFTLALQKSLRKTNLPDLDYDSDQFNLTAQFIY